MRRARLFDRKTNLVVSAEVIGEVTPKQLVETEERWKKFRLEAREKRKKLGIPVPEHNHWNWDEKSLDLKFTAYRCLGIEHEQQMQGLMMISTLAVQGRSSVHKGKPALYVKYLEAAPWNLKQYVGDDARFGGVGISLIAAAIETSVDEEFRGRIALHSLPQAEAFYSKYMEDLGIDLDMEKLCYFEMSEGDALKFVKGGDV